MEVDGGLHPFGIAESRCPKLDASDSAVDAFGQCIGSLVFPDVENSPEMFFDHTSDLLDRFQPRAYRLAVPEHPAGSSPVWGDILPQDHRSLLQSPYPCGFEAQA